MNKPWNRMWEAARGKVLSVRPGLGEGDGERPRFLGTTALTSVITTSWSPFFSPSSALELGSSSCSSRGSAGAPASSDLLSGLRSSMCDRDQDSTR